MSVGRFRRVRAGAEYGRVLSLLGQLATAIRHQVRRGIRAAIQPVPAALSEVGPGLRLMGMVVSRPLLRRTVGGVNGARTARPEHRLEDCWVALFFTVINGFAMGALAGLEGYAALGRASFVSGVWYVLLTILAEGSARSRER